MLRLLLLVSLVTAFGGKETTRTIISPDKRCRIVIYDFKKEEATIESKVRILDSHEKGLFDTSFVSEDGEHGFGVVKAAWSDNSDFIIFALSSSGGHQAWHVPTFAFSISKKRLISLDNTMGPVTSLFTTLPPDSLVFQTFAKTIKDQAEVRVRLSALVDSIK
jgi:hypothetical protein